MEEEFSGILNDRSMFATSYRLACLPFHSAFSRSNTCKELKSSGDHISANGKGQMHEYIIIIRYRQVVRPHRLPCFLKVYLSIRLLHLRGRDTQAGSMGTSNPDIPTMGPPSKIGNNVTDHSCGHFEFAS